MCETERKRTHVVVVQHHRHRWLSHKIKYEQQKIQPKIERER